MTETEIPSGYDLLPTGLGYTDSLQPCYRKLAEEQLSFGLVVLDVHTNTMGICHGGVLATMADISAASGVNLARGKRSGSPTINLSIDFISAARRGEWIYSDIDHVTVKRRYGFCSGTIRNHEGIVVRFNGTFYLPDHKGMWKGEPIGDGVLTENKS